MEEISLREIIEVLLKRKWTIAAVTAIALLISGFVSFFVLSPVYKADVVINIRGGERQSVTELNDFDLETLLDQLIHLPLYDIETYKRQIISYPFLENLIDTLRLDPEDYTPLSLMKTINIEQVPNTSLMKITIKDGDPEVASKIANQAAELFIEAVSNQNLEQIETASAYFLNQLDEKELLLAETMERYRLFLHQPRGVDELKAETDSKIEAVTVYKVELANLQVNLATAEIEKESLQRELDAISPVVVTKKSITDDPLVMRAYEEGDMDFQELSALEMETEEMNPVYYELQSSLKNKTVEIESTAKRITATKLTLQDLERELESLRVEYMDKSMEQRRLEREVEYCNATLDKLEDNYLELQMLASLGSEEVTFDVVSPAYPPQSPVQPRKMLNMAIAGVLGIMGSAFFVFFLHYWETSKLEKQGANIFDAK